MNSSIMRATLGSILVLQAQLACSPTNDEPSYDPAEVEAADAVVLPGVGAFGACMAALASTGLDEQARKAASRLNQRKNFEAINEAVVEKRLFSPLGYIK